MNILELVERKKQKSKISMVTCYDAWSAGLIAESPVDMILVGDSAAMVMHGFQDTVPATNEMMKLHIAAVRRGAPRKFIVGDLPFMSYRGSIDHAMETVREQMQAGANAIKLEGCLGNERLIERLVQSGVPVMGHLGLTPQSVNVLGGNKVQGRSEEAQKALLEQARTLEEVGCFSLVLECVPADLAARVTETLSRPTIGIGAGPHCDGQVLVLQDLLGFNRQFRPKFLRQFMNGGEQVLSALGRFHEAVQSGNFPSQEESYE